MKRIFVVPALIGMAASALFSHAQDAPSSSESHRQTRYAVEVLDDATFYGGMPQRYPTTLNRILLEPSFGLKVDSRFTLSSSLIGVTTTHIDTASQILVRESYAGLSAGDFDFTAGRKMVRWGTGYAFTAAGVLDPPRIPRIPPTASI